MDNKQKCEKMWEWIVARGGNVGKEDYPGPKTLTDYECFACDESWARDGGEEIPYEDGRKGVMRDTNCLLCPVDWGTDNSFTYHCEDRESPYQLWAEDPCVETAQGVLDCIRNTWSVTSSYIQV